MDVTPGPDNRLSVKFTVVSEHWTLERMPSYASAGAAGMDLHACVAESLDIHPGKRVRVATGIAMQLPHAGVVGLVYARSGLAWRSGLALPNGVGVIDSDYTGEIQVLLTNFSQETVTIDPGDRIAQLVVAPVYLVDWVRVAQLECTARGGGGFGSTGV